MRIVTVNDEDPVLRTPARPVRRVDRAVRLLMDDMIDTMRAAPGVGLAAPQVGVNLRVIVVETPVDADVPDGPTRVQALANPEIVWCDPEVEEGQEACLSVPALLGDVPRYVSVRVRGIDPAGKRVEILASGFEARVYQHEIDHLDGVLFTDRVQSLEKLHSLQDVSGCGPVPVPFSVSDTASRP